MSLEKDEIVEGAGLANDPSAQTLWDEIEAQERGGAAVTDTATTTTTTPEPGTDAGSATTTATEPAAAAAGAAVDPYADLPPAVRDELLGLKEVVGQLQGRVRNTEGHIGGLRTQLQRELGAAAAAQTRAGNEAPTQQQIADASKSPSALARLVEDYPEFGGAVKEVLDAQAQEITGLKQALTQRPQQDPDREALKEQVVDLTIRIKHPDWKKTVVDPAFTAWVQTQPREVQALYASSHADDVIRLLDIRTKEAEAKRQADQSHDQGLAKRKAAAQRAAGIPAGRSAAAIHAKDVDALSPEELWAHLDAVEAAK